MTFTSIITEGCYKYLTAPSLNNSRLELKLKMARPFILTRFLLQLQTAIVHFYQITAFMKFYGKTLVISQVILNCNPCATWHWIAKQPQVWIENGYFLQHLG